MYPVIRQCLQADSQQWLAGKVTGMLLDQLSISELHGLISEPTSVNARVEEALAVLSGQGGDDAVRRASSALLRDATLESVEQTSRQLQALPVVTAQQIAIVARAICSQAFKSRASAKVMAAVFHALHHTGGKNHSCWNVVVVVSCRDGFMYRVGGPASVPVGPGESRTAAFASRAEALSAGKRSCSLHRDVLNHCQVTFEQTTSSPSTLLGCVRFTGELYKKNLVTTRIIAHCVTCLLHHGTTELVGEAELEAACSLLFDSGERMDADTQQIEYRDGMTTYMAILQQLVDQGRHSARVLSDCREVLALRRRAWKQGAVATTSSPARTSAPPLEVRATHET